jgi:hypothetical protein
LASTHPVAMSGHTGAVALRLAALLVAALGAGPGVGVPAEHAASDKHAKVIRRMVFMGYFLSPSYRNAEASLKTYRLSMLTKGSEGRISDRPLVQVPVRK